MEKLIRAINASPYKAFITVTGGGTRFISDYLESGGGSQTILGFYVPYTEKLTDQFIGKRVKKYASEECAKELALESFVRASSLCDNPVGVGVTCNLGKVENERPGREHRIHIAVYTANTRIIVNRYLNQSRSRIHEEKITAREIFKALAIATEFSDSIEVDKFGFDMVFTELGESREVITEK